MLDVIICAYFGMGKLRGLGYAGGQSLGSVIETASPPYNSAVIPHSLLSVLSGSWSSDHSQPVTA